MSSTTQEWSSQEEWKTFVHDLPGSALPQDTFRQLKSYLDETDFVRAFRVASGFRVFTKLLPEFRSDLISFVQDKLPIGEVSPASGKALSCLVAYCQDFPNSGNVALFVALSRHRAYHDPPALQGASDLGDELRTCLIAQISILKGQGTSKFIPAFQGAREQPIPGDNLSRWDVFPNGDYKNGQDFQSKWDKPFNAKMLDILREEDTIKSLDWTAKYNGELVLRILQRALLSAYKGDKSLATANALQRHLNRCCQLWSVQFGQWSWDFKLDCSLAIRAGFPPASSGGKCLHRGIFGGSEGF